MIIWQIIENASIINYLSLYEFMDQDIKAVFLKKNPSSDLYWQRTFLKVNMKLKGLLSLCDTEMIWKYSHDKVIQYWWKYGIWRDSHIEFPSGVSRGLVGTYSMILLYVIFRKRFKMNASAFFSSALRFRSRHTGLFNLHEMRPQRTKHRGSNVTFGCATQFSIAWIVS
jgi:hypothetical protein